MCLSSCGLRKDTVERAVPCQEIKSEGAYNKASLYEAKWSDVPLPLNVCVDSEQTRESHDQRGCVFVYTTPLAPSDCLDFYKREMERLGWRQALIVSFDPPEHAVFYEKPSQLATVSIQERDQQSIVRLYIGQKKEQLQ